MNLKSNCPASAGHHNCCCWVQEELEETQDRIAKYDARLREVRERKAAMAAALDPDEEGPADRADFDDVASEGGSSVVSGLSAYTQASAGRASTAASTGRSPSTVGGRWPQRQRKKVSTAHPQDGRGC